MLKKLAKINVVVLAIVLTCIVFSQTGQGYISNKLPLDQQSSLRGGGCNESCRIDIWDDGCWTVPDCTDANDCNEGPVVCLDATWVSKCESTVGGYCTPDEDHQCAYKYTLSGSCYRGQMCNTNFYNLGPCGTSIKQCMFPQYP